ncbi:MAG: phasin family protein [Pseudomonadota bacterium]
MNNEVIENMNKMGKSSYDAMKELYDINMRIVGQMSEQQAAYVNLMMDCATSQMDMLGKSKDYKEIISKQTSLMSEASEKAQGIARNTVDIFNESKDEVSAWVEKGVKEASDVVPFAKSA